MWVYTSNQCALSSWRYHSSLKNTRAHTNHTQSAAIALIFSRRLVVRQCYANVTDVDDVLALMRLVCQTISKRISPTYLARPLRSQHPLLTTTCWLLALRWATAVAEIKHRHRLQAFHPCCWSDATTNYSVLIFGASKYLFFAFQRRSHQVTNRPNACHE